jgi:arylformamidase
VRETSIAFSSHTGTHIDAPSHFLEHGESVDHISLAKINGPCVVLDCTDVDTVITAHDLAKHTIHSAIILLKTKNSQRSDNALFDSQFTYLDQSAAQ